MLLLQLFRRVRHGGEVRSTRMEPGAQVRPVLAGERGLFEREELRVAPHPDSSAGDQQGPSGARRRQLRHRRIRAPLSSREAVSFGKSCI